MAKYRRQGNFGPRTVFAQTRFELQLDEFLNKIMPEKQTAAFREIVQEVNRKLVKRSPVDTGRFRGNWYVSINTPDRTVSEGTDKNGDKTIERGERVINRLEIGNIAIISNNLPYAVMLEYGWSKQAPNGMAAITLEEVKAKLEGGKGRSS